MAWPAFGVLIVTGVWNVIAVRSQITGSYQTTLVIKLIVVAISGVTTALHARASTYDVVNITTGKPELGDVVQLSLFSLETTPAGQTYHSFVRVVVRGNQVRIAR